jgi:dTMP kinase
MATAGLEPDIKILLDLPVETALRRRLINPDEVNRMDKEAIQFHSRVRGAYHSLAAADPVRWRVVDASRSEEVVWSDVLLEVNLTGITSDSARSVRETLK